jgi:hypothetical protein
MNERRCDVAFWLLPSSSWPEIVEIWNGDRMALSFDIVQQVMTDHRETYVYKAAIWPGFGVIRRYWHVRLPRSDDGGKRVLVGDVVKQLWPLVEADGIDPVEVTAAEALSLVRIEGESEPGSVFGRWCRGAMASDERLLAKVWGDWRGAEVRRRLVWEEAWEAEHGRS